MVLYGSATLGRNVIEAPEMLGYGPVTRSKPLTLILGAMPSEVVAVDAALMAAKEGALETIPTGGARSGNDGWSSPSPGLALPMPR